jgi:hypothetical protein
MSGGDRGVEKQIDLCRVTAGSRTANARDFPGNGSPGGTAEACAEVKRAMDLRLHLDSIGPSVREAIWKS